MRTQDYTSDRPGGAGSPNVGALASAHAMTMHTRCILQRQLLALGLMLGCLAWHVWFVGLEPAAPAAAREFFFHHDHILGTSLDLYVVATTEAEARACERVVLDEIERLRR